MKIKILFYSHTIDYAGTWRSHERILLNLNPDIFDVYVFYNPNQNNNRLDYLRTRMNPEKIISFNASRDKLSSSLGYPYRETNFSEIVKKYNFDIIHFARSGYFEWPFTERLAPIQIETNIFGYKDNSSFLDFSVPISETVNKLRGGSDKVIYNPIPKKMDDKSTLKNELNISDDTIVFGRIGRSANYSSISFDALRLFKNQNSNFKYIVIDPCPQVKNTIQNYGLQDNCILIDSTNDDFFIHKFFNTIDIFLHYRSDGETFGTAIAQSMVYGKPVISHFAGSNGQVEIIGNGGFVCSNAQEYYTKIVELTTNKLQYNLVSENAINFSKKYMEDEIVKQWEEVYLSKIKR